MNKFGVLVVFLVLACTAHSSAAAPPPSACKVSAESARALVLAFYEEALLQKQPRRAFEQYASADFVEHKQDVPEGTRDAVVAFLEGLIKQLPAARWEVLRTIAEPELVFLHARFVPAPGAPAYSIADVFRIEDCKIVEHWDVVAPPRSEQAGADAGEAVADG